MTTTTIDGNVVEYNDTNLVKNNEDHVDSNYNGNTLTYTHISVHVYMYTDMYTYIRIYIVNTAV